MNTVSVFIHKERETPDRKTTELSGKSPEMGLQRVLF